MVLHFRTLARVPGPRLCLIISRSTATHARQSSSSVGPAEEDIKGLLSKPTWSVQSLLPDSSAKSQLPTVTPKQLHHLLRLSALPQPRDKKEEDDMLQTLESQIHFVKEIQRVDTTGVTPLRSIRDETEIGKRQYTVDLKDLESTLGREQRVGMMQKIHRKKADEWEYPDGREVREGKQGKASPGDPEYGALAGDNWEGNALQAASKTQGDYFVVQSPSDHGS